MSYKIEYMQDDHDCETCGWCCAEGYKIYKNGVLVLDKSPVAHCYDSVNFPHDNAAFEILKLEGIAVEVNSDDY